MIRGSAVVALALISATLATAADDPNAPLAGAKQQLQSLRKDEAAQKVGTPGTVQLDLPSLNTSEASATPSPQRREERAGQEKAKARRDWLLDGFNQLERRKPGSGAAAKDDEEREAEAKPLDPSDPDYFLRVYERQRAQSEARRLDAGGAPDAKLANSTSADPFAPFMKEWLANSPVRDALKDAIPSSGQSGDAVLPGAAAEEAPAHTATTLNTSQLDSSTVHGPASTNPFVQALGLSSIDQPKPAESRPLGVEQGVTPAPPVAPTSATVYDLPERAKPDLKLALPPPPSEDKKYFPQLKKF